MQTIWDRPDDSVLDGQLVMITRSEMPVFDNIEAAIKEHGLS